MPYTAPEQFRADADLGACDVWALGVILFELLTGQRHFNGGNQGATAREDREGGAGLPEYCPQRDCDRVDQRIVLDQAASCKPIAAEDRTTAT